eukprot:1075631-Pleurochrysis_carterae.AAC.1
MLHIPCTWQVVNTDASPLALYAYVIRMPEGFVIISHMGSSAFAPLPVPMLDATSNHDGSLLINH